MKTRIVNRWIATAVAAGLLLLAVVPAVHAQSKKKVDPKKAPAKKVELTKSEIEESAKEIPKAVFDDPESNRSLNLRNPFFPKTKKKETPGAPALTAPPPPKHEISLKGFGGTPGARLVMINNQSMAEGESGRVRTPQGTVTVQVLQIKERSAVVQVEGEPEPKEIFLKRD